jgi:hypothetical protein
MRRTFLPLVLLFLLALGGNAAAQSATSSSVPNSDTAVGQEQQLEVSSNTGGSGTPGASTESSVDTSDQRGEWFPRVVVGAVVLVIAAFVVVQLSRRKMRPTGV